MISLETFPRTPEEELLAGIWANVLGLEHVGIHDNFFELGGNSQQASQVLSRIRDIFSVDWPLNRLLESPSIAQLSEALSQACRSYHLPPITPVNRDQPLPLSFAQERLWFLAQLEGTGKTSYNMPGLLRLEGPLHHDALEQTLQALVQRHECFRTCFPTWGEGNEARFPETPPKGAPVVHVFSALNHQLSVINLQNLSAKKQEIEIQRLVNAEVQRHFNLAKGPLLRSTLLQLDDKSHILLVNIHHIIFDDWSTWVFYQDFSTLYKAFSQAKPSPLPPLPIQYVDFAHWQRQWLTGDILNQQRNYWQQQLAGLHTGLELPVDHPRPAVQHFRGAKLYGSLSPALTARLKKLSQQTGTTLFMTLLSACATLFYRYSGQTDIVIGSPVPTRTPAQLQSLVGFLVNVLVFRLNLEGNTRFDELLRQARRVALAAYAHQDIPFQQVIEALQPNRKNTSQSPLLQVMLELHNRPVESLDLPELNSEFSVPEDSIAVYNLSLAMVETAEGLKVTLKYNTDLFEPATIERLVGHFQTLLEGIVENPQQRIHELPLLTKAEQQQLLAWNDTAVDYPVEKCIHQLFEQQVEKTPEAIAVVFENQQVSYAALNQKANQLAHYLPTLGVKPEVLVGLCVKRSVEMIIGLLGILKAGGAYLPLDPTYPAARLTFMLEDACVPVLLTQSSLKEKWPSHQASVVCLDGDWAVISRHRSENLDSGVKPENLAYVIYTSGSTGNPKGVMIQHQSLVNFVDTAIIEYGLNQHDCLLQFASISFDAAAEEIYPCLASGGRLVLRFDEMLNSIPLFLQHCRDLGLTVLDLPTAFWHQVIFEVATSKIMLPNSLRLVIIGGERALSEPVGLWQQWVGATPRLVNTYGPTEATVVTTMYPLPSSVKKKWRDIPIGRAIHNVQTYVLDKCLQPVPLGIPGELHLGGVCLARGYLNRPELTFEKFIPNPFSENPSSRLYKTGDLVRYLPDGYIEYLGRIDNQVKIRGFRIELSEIEAVLRQHPDVQESVVIAQQDQPGNLRLVAYIVSDFMPERLPYQSTCLAEVDGKTVKLRTEDLSKSGVGLVEIPTTFRKGQHIRLCLQLPGENEERWLNGTVRWSHLQRAGIQFQLTPTEQALLDQSVAYSQQGFLKVLQRTVTNNMRNYLKKKLPDYMLPYRFVLLKALPFTPNGKINRRVIEQLSVDGYPLSEDKFAEPRTPEEEQLVGIWADVLGGSQIGIHDDFFELGGHSLLATQLISRIHESFSIALPLHCLFDSPTVAGIAQTLNQIRQTGIDVVVATNTVIDFNAEAVLEPTIQPPPTRPVEGVLLTGATGFLGVYLLYELLAQTTADIYCLVRSPNVDEGKKRLQNKLESCSLWHDSFNARIIPIIGDLSLPLLGLSDSLFHLLASQIEAIYHSGAMVNFVYPYSKLKATNVLGTIEVLKLASQIKAKPVHFISTLSVFADSGVRVVRESDIDNIQALDDNYSQSKWVAEKLVMQARERGLPVCIYRPSRITGHSQTGISNLNDLFSRGIKGGIHLGLLPPIDDIEDNMVPVDYVSRAIVHLSRQTELLGKAFHLVNPQSVLCGYIINHIHSLGYPLEHVSFSHWRTELSCQKENALYPLLSFFDKENSEKTSLIEPQFDCQNTIEGLAGTDIVCPPINTQLLDLYFSYFWRCGFLEAP